MRKQRKSIPKRLLCFALSAVLLLGILPVGVFAAPDSTAAAEYTIVAHGGTIAYADGSDDFDGTAPDNAVLTVSFEENQFPGKIFDYWKSADGTEIPQQSFRLLVNRNAAFYPVFKDVAGNFGPWETLIGGSSCNEAPILVRTDSAQGLKEYKLGRSGYHQNLRYERIDDGNHRVACADCSYTYTTGHRWNSGVVTTQATHLADGVKTYTCYDCGAKKYEKIEKGGSHTYPDNPKDSDYIIDEPALNGQPGLRHLKCTQCGFEQEPTEYIAAELPGSTGKVQHFTYERTSPYSSSSSMNQARVEEHYISDSAYYYSVKKANVGILFEFLWFDHGKQSPVYIKSGTTYGTRESDYYGIVAYADSREEFLRMIYSSVLLSSYDNGLHSAMLESPLYGSRYFAQLWNQGESTRNKLKPWGDPQLRPGWNTPVTEYEYKYSSTKTIQLYVDEHNVCVYQNNGSGETMELKFAEELETFPFAEPNRAAITWYGYQVTDGTFGEESWACDYFGMLSADFSVESRTAKPNTPREGQYFSHWEKYDFDTKQYEYCTDEETWAPTLSDVTRLRAVFKDHTYHIKVNGGYYQVYTEQNQWSDETYTEGDVIYGTKIRLISDSSLIPEGMQTDGFVDQSGNRLDSTTFTPSADGEYTAVYKDKEAYFSASARNGVVKKDGEPFYGGSLPIGAQISLTTESSDSGAYPYFIGWCTVRYGMTGEEYTVVSTESTYTTTVTDSYEDNSIVAVWSDSPTLPEKVRHSITAVNGFVSNENSVFVSHIRVPTGSYVQIAEDPSQPLKVHTWVAADAETGTEIERQEASDYGAYFLITAGDDGGKGDAVYPANVTITGETDVCADHTWDDGVVTKEPNYVAEGEKTFTCTVCGTRRTEAIAKLDRYCVHACTVCGKCTLPADDPACGYERCACETPQKPIIVDQSGTVAGTPEGVTLTAVAVQGDSEDAGPYLAYCLEAAEGYQVETIYDLSLVNPDGSEYTLADGETATVTLDVGKENAQAISDGRLYIIHIAATGKETYGVGYKPVTVDAENGTVTFETESFSPFLLAASPIEYYGRNAIAGLANKDALLYAYDRIVSGVENSAATIGIYNGANAITQEELKAVFDAYRRDHTEHFWLGNSYSISYNAATVLSLTPSYTLSGTALQTAKTAFDAAVSEMLSGITSSMSEYAREKLLHDRLAARVTYDGTGANAHNAYGALVEGKAVCEGYAEAFQYLLQKAGIQSFIITGTSSNPATGSPEGHAWNAVRIDGRYYHVDVTWDDQGENIFYAYFNKTDAAILEDHTIDTTAYPLPVCSSEAADYFYVNGGRLPLFDLNAVAALLKNGGGTARVYVTGDKAAFSSAFTANASALASKLGYTGGYSYGYANLGREFILTVTPVGVTVSGSITCFGSETDVIRVELIKAGQTAATHHSELTGSQNSDGSIQADYSFSAVAAGTYTLRVSKQNHVTREYTITVGAEAVTQDVKIHLKGDVNGDGKITNLDVTRLSLHFRKKATLTDYELLCADVSGDGKITNLDVTKIKLHFRKKAQLW